jgi:hypothetical protein
VVFAFAYVISRFVGAPVRETLVQPCRRPSRIGAAPAIGIIGTTTLHS